MKFRFTSWVSAPYTVVTHARRKLGTPYSKSEVYKQLLVLQQDRQTAE